MGPERSLGLLVLFACVGLAAARSTLQVIFKNAGAFQSLNENQQKCGATSYDAAPYESQCEKKECFCANPQFMSDKTDECLIYYEGFSSQQGIYNIDVYNGIMTFFANECGTFEVQSKSVMTQSVTYTMLPTQTNFGSGAQATGGSGSANDNSRNNNLNVNVSGNGSSTISISDPKLSEAPPPSRALKVEAIVGIVAGVFTVIGVIVTVYVRLKRRNSKHDEY